MQKPSIPKGTRDFSPKEMVKRNYIFNSIKKVFELYGYNPIETPAMENLGTLLGKYGEEGDKLLFRILNSGDFLKDAAPGDLINPNLTLLSSKLCKKGLRYDLTVPFARFVVQYQSDITFPFKRYQVQPVWRADRPQKGRYQEFYQCDADVVGSNSLLNEVELINIINDVFKILNISVLIKINNRKILAGIAEFIGAPDKIVDVTVAIDKLEKVGLKNVNDELREKGLSDSSIEKLQPILSLKGTNIEKIEKLYQILEKSELGIKGLEEIKMIFDFLNQTNITSNIELDLTLARGLNYYTGAIIEVKSTEVEIGSICGGGRYDDLTSVFGLNGISGVGISFGADRIYDVLNQLDRYPKNIEATTQVLFVNFGEKEQLFCLKMASKLRQKGVSTEVYPDPVKLKKQLGYANNKNVPWVIFAGEEEILKDELTLKNMLTGEQKNYSADKIVNLLCENNELM